MGKRIIKMHGTTPTGRSRSYSYYATMQKVNGRKIRIAVEEIDEQIPSLLERLHVSPEALPQVKELYREHIAALQGPTVQERVSELEDRIERLKEEEAALARLYARGKLTDRTMILYIMNGRVRCLRHSVKLVASNQIQGKR